jgi:isoquinoline 1-oxidoreductase subunit alpha
MTIPVTVNGREWQIDADEDTPLLWAIREHCGLPGTKFGCGAGLCGACTVHIDGTATRSCVTPLGSVKNARITTIEGLGAGAQHPVQRAWIAEQVPQCGYCQSGMIMAAAALLSKSKRPTDSEIAQTMTNICRCGTYPRIRRAIHRAAGFNA